jgi:hypothetical protein
MHLNGYVDRLTYGLERSFNLLIVLVSRPQCGCCCDGSQDGKQEEDRAVAACCRG